VEDLPAATDFALVIVPSPETLGTPEVYREADRLPTVRPRAALEAAEREVRAALAAGEPVPPVNDLQDAARSLCPSIGPVLEDVARHGARSALVTGSGPTVFGVFDDPERAEAAAAALRDRHPAAVAVRPAGPGDASVREVG
jgi:4-diphosphocytidyl-2-C-methyl-D-erythritol kinase